MAILPAAAWARGSEGREATELDCLKCRETAAWTVLFEREHGLVFRVVLGRVGDRAVAEDITGQVFLDAIEGIHRYRDRGRPLSAWLLGIARNRTADWFRRRRREQGVAVEPSIEGPENDLAVALGALDTLTPEQREIIHLRFVEGYSLEETSGLTRRSLGAVKSMQHRALTRLRAVLGEETYWRS